MPIRNKVLIAYTCCVGNFKCDLLMQADSKGALEENKGLESTLQFNTKKSYMLLLLSYW